MSRTEADPPPPRRRVVAHAVLGVLLGAPLGIAAGVAFGLAWVELAGTSGFEGFSGYIVAFTFAPLGLIAGAVLGGWVMAGRARRPLPPLKAPTG